jgi:hypothetical protein
MKLRLFTAALSWRLLRVSPDHRRRQKELYLIGQVSTVDIWSAQVPLTKEESKNSASERSGEQGGQTFSQYHGTKSGVFVVPQRPSASFIRRLQQPFQRHSWKFCGHFFVPTRTVPLWITSCFSKESCQHFYIFEIFTSSIFRVVILVSDVGLTFDVTRSWSCLTHPSYLHKNFTISKNTHLPLWIF